MKVDITKAVLKASDDGDYELALSIPKDFKLAARTLCTDMRACGTIFTATIAEKKKRRSLDQNAFMWELLTIYANHLNGGRTGGTTPDDLYMRFISTYGDAVFIMAVTEAESDLLKAFRVVKKVDARDYNGKELIVYKCFYGSSEYDTKQMTNLIEGIMDEMAKADIDFDYQRREWNEFKKKEDKKDA